MLAVLENSFVSKEYKTNYSTLVENWDWQLGCSKKKLILSGL